MCRLRVGAPDRDLVRVPRGVLGPKEFRDVSRGELFLRNAFWGGPASTLPPRHRPWGALAGRGLLGNPGRVIAACGP